MPDAETLTRPAPDLLERKVELAWLAAFYSGKLTERQRQILSLYCEEDMSLAEIGQETGVSRQAVYETLDRAAGKLEELEKSLHMAVRFQRVRSGLEAAIGCLDNNQTAEAKSLLRSLLDSELETI